jgi:hypothetical protein
MPIRPVICECNWGYKVRLDRRSDGLPGNGARVDIAINKSKPCCRRESCLDNGRCRGLRHGSRRSNCRCNPVVDNLEVPFAVVFFRLLRFKLQGNHCEMPVVRGCNRGFAGCVRCSSLPRVMYCADLTKVRGVSRV